MLSPWMTTAIDSNESPQLARIQETSSLGQNILWISSTASISSEHAVQRLRLCKRASFATIQNVVWRSGWIQGAEV